MESILARALEYTLKYWLKSFSREQFKLQGRTVKLSNLDINGDALHASVGLPLAIKVTKAKVGKLEIMLPSVSNVQVEPIVVQIDKLDLVLEENPDEDSNPNPSSSNSSTSTTKGSGYGFADKISDGMTLEVKTVNLLLETCGGSRGKEGATWASPLASITIYNLILYATNENWEVVNLKEARNFSTNTKFIYVFRRLEWESLSIDLLPHPDMFADARFSAGYREGANQRDEDGAKRIFFGGERFIEGISGQANITLQRTEQNTPLGLEVQLHITEAVCPALSEPGLRAFLRFMTGLYVCLNRGDVDPKAQQLSTEVAGRFLFSVVVDHIFLCIKDAEFQLELLMQSLFFSRASVSNGENDNNMTRVMIGGLFLRDTFSRPPCTLVQPSMHSVTKCPPPIPEFAENLCPPIYPLGDQQSQLNESIPLLSMHSLQVKPSPVPPLFAIQTVINCQPLTVHLQEESCFRISSFLVDGVVVNPGVILPDFSVNAFIFTLEELDISVPLDVTKLNNCDINGYHINQSSFNGARFHIANLVFSDSPSLRVRSLNLDKDPACFSLWKDQPVDASQKKSSTRVSHLSLCLEKWTDSTGGISALCTCVELKDLCVEIAMVTEDGSPLTDIPPPGGVVRVGVAFQQFLSNTSVEQLFFVLDFYAYFGQVSEKISLSRKNNKPEENQNEVSAGSLVDKVPSDTAVILALKDLQLRFLESSSMNIEGIPLVQFIGDDLFIKVSHRTFGGAVAISSTIRWDSVQVDCVDTEENYVHENGAMLSSTEDGPVISSNGPPQLRAVLWVHNKRNHLSCGNVFSAPLLDISTVHVILLNEKDMECHSLNVSACIAGVRLGGGMNYAEALLHRFGILGPDGRPGKELSEGLENLQNGPFSKLFKTSPIIVKSWNEGGASRDGEESGFLALGKPDDVDVSIELKDWLFALEGAQELRRWSNSREDMSREEGSWHISFQSLSLTAKSTPKDKPNRKIKPQKFPMEFVTVGVEGLQISKPQSNQNNHLIFSAANGMKDMVETYGGIALEVRIMVLEDEFDAEMIKWVLENVKFSVKHPIEAVVTKDELQYLTLLCKSEVDSMGRITAGIIRLLKLEDSIGQSAMNQLNNLGTESIDKIFAPAKRSRGCSPTSMGLSPSARLISERPNRTAESPASHLFSESPRQSMKSTVACLEEAVTDSQVTCAALITELCNSDPSTEHLMTIKQLTQKLESMQSLLTKLRNQI